MRRSDDVFFFTLIDFLLQVFFFGLLLFVVGQALRADEDVKREQDDARVAQLMKSLGVSNITELTDYLSKLAPLDQLRGTKDFIDRNGGLQNVKAAVDAANVAGGPTKVSGMAGQMEAMSKRLAQLEGWGKTSCIPNIVVNGKLQPKSIGRVVVYDDAIELAEPTDEMSRLLSTLGLQFNSVRRLSLSDFRSTFAPVVARQPECRYFLDVSTRTQYLAPMRAVWSVFRTQ